MRNNVILKIDGVRLYLEPQSKAVAEILDRCGEAAERAGCEFELECYPAYGFSQGAFLVDRFGGIALLFRIVDGRYELWQDGAYIPCDGLDDILAQVPEAVEKEREARSEFELFNCD